MQKIFYNAKVQTQNDTQPQAEAFFVNDDKIVLVGSNDEILQMKQENTEVVDLDGKFVYPTFFDCNASVYQMIENSLKNANLSNFLENNDEFDENYDKFCNYDKYKEEFLKIQKDYIANGITTIQEIDVSAKEFTFWKKMSEEKLLMIDIIAYINFSTNKNVMDNNCRSYRKYKNHFRIGGYYVKLDGTILTSSAWISKPYRGTKSFNGYSHIFDEQLSYIIKTSLEEKKQLFVEANGDRAIDQFLRIFSEVKEKEKPEDLFRPILHSPTQLTNKHIKKLKEFGVIPSFDFVGFDGNYKAFKNMLGVMRVNKILPIKQLYNHNLDYLSHTDRSDIPSVELFLKSLELNRKIKKVLNKNNITSDSIISKNLQNSSYLTFDNELKGSLEVGKFANFVTLKRDSNLSDFEIDSVYIEGNIQTKKG